MKAVNDAGAVSAPYRPARLLTPAGAPGIPTNLVVEGRSTSIAVSWKAPSTGATDADAMSYTATAVDWLQRLSRPAPRGSDVLRHPGAGQRNAVHGLGRCHELRRHPARPPSSRPGDPRRLPASPASPASGPPTAVVVRPRGTARRSCPGPGPRHDGGAQITSYTVTASPGGATCSATAGATSCVVAGLTNGTDYTFTVAASNGTVRTDIRPVRSGQALRLRSRLRAATAASRQWPSPWIGGQYVDLTNISGTVARLGGYGTLGRRVVAVRNGSSVENRAAFLFARNNPRRRAPPCACTSSGASPQLRAARSRTTSSRARASRPSRPTATSSSWPTSTGRRSPAAASQGPHANPAESHPSIITGRDHRPVDVRPM